jgi:uncharacterized protein (DUF58 family)
VTHRISSDRVFEGDTVTVTVEVTARRGAPLIELYEPLTAAGAVVSGTIAR